MAMRYVKVPPEIAIPFLFMLAVIAFTVRWQFQDCLNYGGATFQVCLQP